MYIQLRNVTNECSCSLSDVTMGWMLRLVTGGAQW